MNIVSFTYFRFRFPAFNRIASLITVLMEMNAFALNEQTKFLHNNSRRFEKANGTLAENEFVWTYVLDGGGIGSSIERNFLRVGAIC